MLTRASCRRMRPFVTVPHLLPNPPKPILKLGWAIVFVFYVTIFLALQFWAGAWQSDLGGDPDEAAHAVTSLMIRDYLLHGIPESPLAFAQEYYEAWPKVALGHYPPGYYVPNALALAIDCRQNTLFLVQALWAGLLGCMVLALGRPLLGLWCAFAAGVVMLTMPITVKVGSHVMADLQLVTLILASLWAWRVYLAEGRSKHSLAFGFFATAAILTKGSALSLALVPPVSTLLSKRLGLMKQPSWWLAILPVLLLALPWMVFSVRFTQEGMVHKSPLEYLGEALFFYGRATTWTLGFPLCMLLIAAAVRAIIGFLRSRSLSPLDATLWALVIGTIAVILLVPSGLTSRYLLPLTAASILVGSGFLWLSISGLLENATDRLAVFVGCLGICVGFAYARPSVIKNTHGFSNAARSVITAPSSNHRQNWLISSDPRGEGAIIAAAAFQDSARWQFSRKILRGTKTLAQTDWITADYRLLVKNTSELRQLLKETHIGWVFLDESYPDPVLAHHSLLKRAMEEPDNEWQLWKTVIVHRSESNADGFVKIYQYIE